MSYWMYQGEKDHGITLEHSQEVYDVVQSTQFACNVDFSVQDESSEYTQIGAGNLFFPIIFFVAFAVVAVCLQIFYQRALRNGKGQSWWIGRKSTLNVYNNVDVFKSTRAVQEQSSWTNSNGQTVKTRINFAGDGDVEREDGVQLPQASDCVTTVAKGSFLLEDIVQLDEFHDNCDEHQTVKKRVSVLNSEDNATSQLQTLLDEFLVGVEKIKEQKEL